MNQKNIVYARWAVVALIVFGLVLLGIYLYQLTQFRLVSVQPGDTVPRSVTEITFEFNREIENINTDRFSNSQEIAGAYTINDKSITFTPAATLDEGLILFTFGDLQSKNSDEIIKNSRKKLTVGYVPFNELPKSEQDQQISQSDNAQGEYPITNGVLPVITAGYGVGYLLPRESGLDKLLIQVEVYASLGSRESTAEYNARIDPIHKEVEAIITDNGFKLDDYYILYDNSYLSRYDQPPPFESEGSEG